MEFTVPRNDLAVAVTHAVHGIPNNPLQPVRAGMNIKSSHNGCSFHGSDGWTSFAATISASLGKEESVTVPGRLLSEVVKTLPDKDIHFVTDNLTATLTCGKVEFKFPVYTEEYPELPEPSCKVGEAEGNLLMDAVRKVVPAAVKGDSNPTLSSVYFEPAGDILWAACTDRYRLAAVQVPWMPMETPAPVLVPSWAAERFTRGAAGTVTLGWDDRVITMMCGDVQVTSRRMDGEFPKGWRTLLPQGPCTVEVDAEDLLGALKRAQLATGDGPAEATVELTFTTGRLHVEAGYGNHADDVLDASYTGDEFHALFGIRNLADGLSGCGPVVKFGWADAGKFVYLESGPYTYTIVPRRRI